MQVHIYHSTERGHRFSPWTSEAPMLKVFEGNLAELSIVPPLDCLNCKKRVR